VPEERKVILGDAGDGPDRDALLRDPGKMAHAGTGPPGWQHFTAALTFVVCGQKNRRHKP
jgi:hypothetical protein